ncbi:MAG: DNA repair protein RadA, partial [Acidobacteria bacterium]
QNPSALFLREREVSHPGSAVICALEGTRPLLIEVQALVSDSQYSTARRVSSGMDYNRISLLVAMLEKRLGFHLMGCDIYVNAAGGLEIHEPAADLGIVSAVLSSFRNRPLVRDAVLFGELGLSGEVRPVSQVYPRIREAIALGFRKCILPSGNLPLVDQVQEVELLPVKAISDLSDLIFEP